MLEACAAWGLALALLAQPNPPTAPTVTLGETTEDPATALRGRVPEDGEGEGQP